MSAEFGGEDRTQPDDHRPGNGHARQPRLASGTTVSARFEIVRFLGAGGMGEVYEAEDRFLHGAPVALKAILAESALLPGALERFKREVLLARQITHANVCPVYDIVQAPETPACPCFISMKLLRGETLAARLKRQGRMPVEEAVSVLRQIAGALQAAHTARVLHRDLKPSNIMLEGSGQEAVAIVTDFGLAREYEPDLTLPGVDYVLGTPGYIAPEILSRARPTPACDLYALGVVAHEMLTGEKPAVDPKSGDAVPSPDLARSDAPNFCVELISSCLNRSIDERYRGFARAAQILLPGAASISSLYPTSRRVSRRRVLAIGGATAGAAAAGVWWEWQTIEDWLHPLPAKRFVAVMTWPPEKDAKTKPILSGVVDAIESVLTRLEVTNRNLFVISSREAEEDGARPVQLRQVRDALGTNLVLATSGLVRGDQFRLLLKVFDATSSALLRTRTVVCALNHLTGLPDSAVRAAASLLSLAISDQQNQGEPMFTTSPVAYQAYQEAEELIKQPNFTQIYAAIQKYSEAVNQDRLFAKAYERLAFTYARLYEMRRDPSALDLAKNNAERALELDAKLVEAHLALSVYFEQTGNRAQALVQSTEALELDPANARTLNWKSALSQRMGRWSESERLLRRMVNLRPNYWLSYNQLGNVLALEAKYEDAINAFREATTTGPKQALAWSNLGCMYLRTGRLDEARDAYQTSLNIQEAGDSLTGMAGVMRANARWPEAIQFARKATVADPADDTTWRELGDSLASRGESKGAFDAYFHANSAISRQLHTDSNDGMGWMRLAFYRAKCNPHDIVAPLIGKAEKQGATDIDSLLMKLRTLEVLGKRKEALSAASEVLRRGGTRFEIGLMPDLGSLRSDRLYRQLLGGAGGGAQV